MSHFVAVRCLTLEDIDEILRKSEDPLRAYRPLLQELRKQKIASKSHNQFINLT